MAQMLMWKDTVNNDLYNHGGPTGMKTILTEFVADYRATKAEQEKAKLQKEKDDEKLAKATAERIKSRRFKITVISGGVFLIISTILGWILTLVIPAAKAIMDDYYQRHPTALVQHSSSNTPDPMYAEDKPEISHY